MTLRRHPRFKLLVLIITNRSPRRPPTDLSTSAHGQQRTFSLRRAFLFCSYWHFITSRRMNRRSALSLSPHTSIKISQEHRLCRQTRKAWVRIPSLRVSPSERVIGEEPPADSFGGRKDGSRTSSRKIPPSGAAYSQKPSMRATVCGRSATCAATDQAISRTSCLNRGCRNNGSRERLSTTSTAERPGCESRAFPFHFLLTGDVVPYPWLFAYLANHWVM